MSDATPTPEFSEAMVQRLRAKLTTTLGRHLLDIVDTRDVPQAVTPRETVRLQRKVERLATRDPELKTAWKRTFTPQQRSRLAKAVVEQQLGYGLLEPLLHDPTVLEIMVNGPSDIVVERGGRLVRTALGFRDQEELMALIERMLSDVGRQVSWAEPCVDARLPDGSRLNVVIPPVAVDGPYLTIRKCPQELLSLDALVRQGTLSGEAAQVLEACVRSGLNLAVSGPAASGKTTLMNAIANTIAPEERIVVIEDTTELALPHHHVTRLESRPPNAAGQGELTIRTLLRQALHMRPDRLLVGEVRGEEALDLLQALTSGHDGSMTTVHASHPADVLDRLVTMALLGRAELSQTAVERQVRSAIHVIVQMDRLHDGARVVTSLCEVRPIGQEPAVVELFARTLDERGRPNPLAATGQRPMFLERCHRRGTPLEHVFSAPTRRHRPSPPHLI